MPEVDAIIYIKKKKKSKMLKSKCNTKKKNDQKPKKSRA
jgi:hypothetical protein